MKLFQTTIDVMCIPEDKYEDLMCEIEQFIRSKDLQCYTNTGDEMTDPVLLEKYFDEIDSEKDKINIYEIFKNDTKCIITG